MKQDPLTEIIARGEGASIEFKQSFSPDLGKELCAFANSSGGKILLGITDNGEILGVDDSNRLKSRIQDTARSADPSITIDIEQIESVICIVVPPQKRKPYSFRGKFYLREGANTQQMSRDEIRDFFDREGLLHFDESVCRNFSLDEDLDEVNWSLFRDRAKIPSGMEPVIALRNLRLISEDSRMKNAGAWLLAKDIRKFRISGDISCGLFMGTSKTHILDRRDFHGDICSMINDTVAWILSKINVEYIIKEVQREERPELPGQAIREAVVNAFAHRNYRSTANIQVYLFADRLEIVSPGGLPAGMTESDMGSSSVPRNSLLFGLLHRMDAVEHIGSGIRRIRDLCHEHGVAEPVIRTSDNWVTVTFLRSGRENKTQTTLVTPESGTKIDQSGTKIDQSGTKIDQNGTKIDQNGTKIDQSGTKIDQSGTKIDLSQDQVETLLKCKNEKNAEDLMQAVGRSNRSKFQGKVLRPLIKAGLLEMTIPDKPRSGNQKYRLTEDGEALLHNLQPID